MNIGDELEARLPVLAPVAEISCELPSPPLSIQIKPKESKNYPVQTSWYNGGTKRKKGP